MGTKVEAYYEGRWVPATVRDARAGKYDLMLDNKTTIMASEKDVRLPDNNNFQNMEDEYALNDFVEVRKGGAPRFTEAIIKRKEPGGTYCVEFNDGTREFNVKKQFIRRKPKDQKYGTSQPQITPLREGMKVEADYRGRGKYYPGKISIDRGDGTYDISYDDGERETRVRAELIRPLGGGLDAVRSPSRSARLEEGMKVEADYRGRGRYFPGKISIDRGDGTYDISYDDGERETRVRAELIRPLGGGLDAVRSPSRSARLEEGMKVEADYRGRGRYFPGKISIDRGDGTYDISYDDGERETRVRAELIRPLGGGLDAVRSPSRSARLEEGMKVEADYRGRGRYFPGKISIDRGDGTYDISYDDGERETRVRAELIRPLGGGLDAVRSPSRSARLEEGMKVEADYRGRGRYFPGKISIDRGDGTYDISYDDGERETRVRAELIRPLGGGTMNRTPPRSSRLEEGMKVEADYRGRGRYFPGKLSIDRGDGTYDISYDDGERETRVRAELIRPLGGGTMNRTPPRSSRLEEGMKVEADYRGRGRYFPGKISIDRGDGTYDISYDDGERETRVSRSPSS